MFLIIPVKGENINKNCFSPQIEPHSAKLCLSVVWTIFGEIHRELFFLVNKVTFSETTTDILRKFVFLTMFEKWQNLKKNLDLFKQLFFIKPVKGDKY